MRALFTLLLLLIVTCIFAQNEQVDSLKLRLQGYDSMLQKSGENFGSLQNGYRQKLHSVDSVHASFNQRTDSVQQALQNKLSDLNTVGVGLQHKIDSLKALNLPTANYTHKLDSVNQVGQNTVAEANKRIQSIRRKQQIN